MAVRVTFDQDKLRKLVEAQQQALEMTADAILSDVVSSQVVPKDVGTLERSGCVEMGDKKIGGRTAIEKGSASIIFETPYARRLYYHPEYSFRTDKNPNAQGRWMDMYLEGGSKERYAQEAFTGFFRQLAGRLIR